MVEIKKQKQQLRMAVKNRAQTLSSEYLQASDTQVEQTIVQLDAWKRASSVLIYVSTAWEVSTRSLIQRALASGKTLSVPLCVTDRTMEARQIRSISELSPGRYGIAEPPITATLILPESIELLIIPCITADQQGYRLGRGAAYYDRYLEKSTGTTLCLCRDALLQQELPREAWDVPMDYIVTENRTIIGKQQQ